MIQINEELQRILNEKKGVTSNSTKTLDYIKFLILDCIRASNPYAARPMNLSLNYQLFVEDGNAKYDENKNCIKFNYEFSFPKTATMSWMSDKSVLNISCVRYSSEEDMLKDSTHIGLAQSWIVPDRINQKTIVYMRYIVCFADYPSKDFYIGGYKFTLNNTTELVAAIQHEINHVNKRDNYTETRNYRINHKALMDILVKPVTNKDTNENIVKTIAEMIYRYCIPTEREAFTEQFYREWSSIFSFKGGFVLDNLDKKYKNNVALTKAEREKIATQTKIYHEFLILKNFLDKNYLLLIKKNIAKNLYNNFKDIASYFLKLKYIQYNKDYIAWSKDFIKKIQDNMNQFNDRCIRATHINESETLPIATQIENYWASL